MLCNNMLIVQCRYSIQCQTTLAIGFWTASTTKVARVLRATWPESGCLVVDLPQNSLEASLEIQLVEPFQIGPSSQWFFMIFETKSFQTFKITSNVEWSWEGSVQIYAICAGRNAKDFPCNVMVSNMSSFCSCDFLKSSYYNVTTLRYSSGMALFLLFVLFGRLSEYLPIWGSIFCAQSKRFLGSTTTQKKKPHFVLWWCSALIGVPFLSKASVHTVESVAARFGDSGGPGWQRIQRTLAKERHSDTKETIRKKNVKNNMQRCKLWAWKFRMGAYICVMKHVMHIDRLHWLREGQAKQ